jgi:hypothetical protein
MKKSRLRDYCYHRKKKEKKKDENENENRQQRLNKQKKNNTIRIGVRKDTSVKVVSFYKGKKR